MKKIYHHPDWFGRHVPVWREHLAGVLGGCSRVLEVGSFEGRSACWIAENLLAPDGVLDCVDSWDTDPVLTGLRKAEECFDHNVREYGARVRKHKTASYPFLLRRNLESAPYDVIEIDGCHEGYNVLEDLVLSWPLLRPGGYLVVDDMRWDHENITTSPLAAWNAFAAVKPPGLTLVHFFRQAVARKDAP
jgi:predicted O-methyltransferase YrrM